MRFSRSLPFVFTFHDKFNVKWEVHIETEADAVTMCIPVGTQIIWYGSNEAVRTGSDAQTDWAEVQFYYEAGGIFHSNGVRVQLSAYKDKNKGEWTVDTNKWKNILEMAKTGTEITGAIVSQVGQVVEMTTPAGAIKP